MGLIKTNPQVGIDGKQNGILDLEIIYGGKEAPFGGIDASAPPPYIDPQCFVSANGFVVSNERLVAMNYFQINITLDQWLALGCIYLGSGNYYTNGSYYNWVLGYTTSYTAGSPGLTTTTYYIWVFLSGTTGVVPLSGTLIVEQYDQTINAVAASAQVAVTGFRATSAGTLTITVGGFPVPTAIAINDDPFTVANNCVANLNAASGSTGCTASFDGSIRITDSTPGAAGNSITLTVSISGTGLPTPIIIQGFNGGQDGITEVMGQPINPLSWVAVGETLYFGGRGPMILQFYLDPVLGPQFSILTQYLGAVTLAKYGGFLIAGGIIPGPGTVIQASEMVIAWCANGQYGIWNPLDSAGNVTGAGFNEISDLSDYITAIFIMNSIAIILHTQGIDYLTLLGSGLQPFDFEHVSISKTGEGCQSAALACQYDQIGFFVGNTDVFEYSGGLKEIGAKIRQLLIPNSQTALTINRSSIVGPVVIDTVSIDVLAHFIIDFAQYIYNVDDKTWMQYNFTESETLPNFLALAYWSAFANNGAPGAQFNTQLLPVLVTQAKQNIFPFHSQPVFWQFKAGIANTDFSRFLGTTNVIFPEEEVSFGRDITIEGIYISLVALPGQVVNFSITTQLKGNVLTASGVITTGAEADGVNFKHYKGFLNGGTIVGKNPQLSISVPTNGTGVVNPFQVAKISMFGSFEPNQRPL